MPKSRNRPLLSGKDLATIQLIRIVSGLLEDDQCSGLAFEPNLTMPVKRTTTMAKRENLPVSRWASTPLCSKIVFMSIRAWPTFTWQHLKFTCQLFVSTILQRMKSLLKMQHRISSTKTNNSTCSTMVWMFMTLMKQHYYIRKRGQWNL